VPELAPVPLGDVPDGTPLVVPRFRSLGARIADLVAQQAARHDPFGSDEPYSS
jgi:hypothetical protein